MLVKISKEDADQPASLDNDWVRTEIAKARKRETREKARMLFPVRLVDFETLRDWECFDADAGRDLAREIREYFIPDFTHWKTDRDAYRNAFERLLKDLRSEKAAAHDDHRTDSYHVGVSALPLAGPVYDGL